MFRPYMAIIRFFPQRLRYINCDVEISHQIIVLVCLCIGGYYITLIEIYIYTRCPNKSARFNFLIKRIIYSKSVDIFISV